MQEHMDDEHLSSNRNTSRNTIPSKKTIKGTARILTYRAIKHQHTKTTPAKLPHGICVKKSIEKQITKELFETELQR